jgi:outer membrane protein TolC
VQTPDPVSSNINRGTFFSLGLNFPIFEGFKRIRNVKRQKMVLQQFESEEEVKAHELLQDWRDVEDDLRTAATEMQLAQAQADLARLKMKQAETYYRTGELDFAAFMQARREYVEGQIKVARKSMEYDLAAVELRSLTRELVYRYVKEERFSS